MTVKVALFHGEDGVRYKRVRAYAVTKHLAVTRYVAWNDRANGPYVITHRRSGYRVYTHHFGTDVRLATRWMKRLEREGGDWDYDWTPAIASVQKRPPNNNAMKPLLREWKRVRLSA